MTDMTDMMSTGVVMAVLAVVLLEGDHPGEKGYGRATTHDAHWQSTSEKELP